MDGIGFAEVGVVGIIAIFLINKVFSYIRARNNIDRVNPNTTDELIRDLWEWHNREDAEGVKIWYVRRSLETAVRRLGDVLEEQTNVLRKQGTLLENLCRRTDEIHDHVSTKGG